MTSCSPSTALLTAPALPHTCIDCGSVAPADWPFHPCRLCRAAVCRKCFPSVHFCYVMRDQVEMDLPAGWKAVPSWGTVTYEHKDGSAVAQLDEPYHGPLRGMFALYVGDPPHSAGYYRSPAIAMRAHSEDEL